MSQLKYKKLTLERKKGQVYCTVVAPNTETSITNEAYDVTNSKRSNQPLNKELSDCIERMIPHLLFASEFIDNSINLDKDMDYEKWFKEFEWQKEGLQQDTRFDNVDIDKIVFIDDKDGNLVGVDIFGHKVAVKRSKPKKNTFSSGVIRLDKEEDKYYPLCTLLDEQVHDMILAIDKWLAKGAELKGSQLKLVS